METIMQYIPMAISAILLAALILTVATNIIVQVLKKLTWGKIPTNVLAFIVAMVVTLLAFLPCVRSWAGLSPGTWWPGPWPWACSCVTRLCSGLINSGRPWSRSQTGIDKEDPRHRPGAGGHLCAYTLYQPRGHIGDHFTAPVQTFVEIRTKTRYPVCVNAPDIIYFSFVNGDCSAEIELPEHFRKVAFIHDCFLSAGNSRPARSQKREA